MKVVILAGGRGTRFWPLSRRRKPKQLLALLGGRTMLERTLERAEALVPRESVYLVADRALDWPVHQAVPDLPEGTCVWEPAGRNTAPALVLTALALRARGVPDDEVLIVLPADHLVEDLPAFGSEARRAAEAVRRTGKLLCFGIRPDRPETGYGYIETGAPLGEGVLEVARFVEKPPVEKAKELLASGALWNSGMFVWTLGGFLDAARATIPEIVERLSAVPAEDLLHDSGPLEEAYGELPSVSVDVGILEKWRSVACIPVNFDWSDLGDWVAVSRLWRERNGSRVLGRHVGIESENLVIHSPDRVVATLGVKDLVIVETEDAVLVCPIERAQEVRKLVEELERRGYSDCL